MLQKDFYEDCYAPIIYPMNEKTLWPKAKYVDLQTPPIKRQSGRPKKKSNKNVA